ncbi:MAG: putative quinol monooxygenase [Pseudomonadota bacterium]
MYAVCVTFRLHPGQAAAFMPLMLANATTSKQLEPGCHQFDVATNPDDPEAVFLYELYRNRAAFDAHLARGHFKDFDAAVADMIAEKTVQTWTRVVQ